MTPLQARILSRIQVTAEGCWIWTGARQPDGYGRILGVTKWATLAHRAAYQAFVGPIPDGLHIDHLCRTPPCVNPSHLEPVTSKVNLRRGKPSPPDFNRGKTHCVRGHEFTPQNTRVYGPRGYRSCRMCMALFQRQYRARLAASAS